MIYTYSSPFELGTIFDHHDLSQYTDFALHGHEAVFNEKGIKPFTPHDLR